MCLAVAVAEGFLILLLFPEEEEDDLGKPLLHRRIHLECLRTGIPPQAESFHTLAEIPLSELFVNTGSKPPFPTLSNQKSVAVGHPKSRFLFNIPHLDHYPSTLH